MDKKPSWWQRRKISLMMGQPTAQWRDLGKVEHTVIKFKDKYISIMEGENDQIDFGWSRDPHMFPDVNINDFWTAAPTKNGDENAKR